jgi:hypothetical protein
MNFRLTKSRRIWDAGGGDRRWEERGPRPASKGPHPSTVARVGWNGGAPPEYRDPCRPERGAHTRVRKTRTGQNGEDPGLELYRRYVYNKRFY